MNAYPGRGGYAGPGRQLSPPRRAGLSIRSSYSSDTSSIHQDLQPSARRGVDVTTLTHPESRVASLCGTPSDQFQCAGPSSASTRVSYRPSYSPPQRQTDSPILHRPQPQRPYQGQNAVKSLSQMRSKRPATARSKGFAAAVKALDEIEWGNHARVPLPPTSPATARQRGHIRAVQALDTIDWGNHARAPPQNLVNIVSAHRKPLISSEGHGHFTIGDGATSSRVPIIPARYRKDSMAKEHWENLPTLLKQEIKGSHKVALAASRGRRLPKYSGKEADLRARQAIADTKQNPRATQPKTGASSALLPDAEETRQFVHRGEFSDSPGWLNISRISSRSSSFTLEHPQVRFKSRLTSFREISPRRIPRWQPKTRIGFEVKSVYLRAKDTAERLGWRR